MNEFSKRILTAFKSPKLLIILGLCGIALIALSSLIPSGGSAEAPEPKNEMSAEEYRSMLEASARSLVMQITGDSAASVVVTLDSGFRYSYADTTESDCSKQTGQSAEQSSNSATRSYVTVRSSDGGEQALLVTTVMPEVRGVAIVCQNGNDEETAEKIRCAVMAAFNITSKRVYITGGSNYEKR